MAYQCFGNGIMGNFEYGMMGGYGYGWMFFSWIIGLLVVVGLVIFIIWMVKRLQSNNYRNERRKKFK
jgi:uncharacterized membrane protein